MSEAKTDVASNAQEVLRDLAEGIIRAYEMRVKAISSMMNQAYELIRSYERTVEDALLTVRDSMARGQSLRHRDFDEIVGDISAARASREQQVLERLRAFEKEEKEMIERLREVLACGKTSDLGELQEIRNDTLARQESREREVIRALRAFEAEEHELLAALRPLVEKGENATVEHLCDAVRALTARWKTRKEEIYLLIENLEDTRSSVHSRWRQVMDASPPPSGSEPQQR